MLRFKGLSKRYRTGDLALKCIYQGGELSGQETSYQRMSILP